MEGVADTGLVDCVRRDVAERLPLWQTNVVPTGGVSPIVVCTSPPAEDGTRRVKGFVCVEVSERVELRSAFVQVVAGAAEHCRSHVLKVGDALMMYIAFVDNGGTVVYYECELAAP